MSERERNTLEYFIKLTYKGDMEGLTVSIEKVKKLYDVLLQELRRTGRGK